MSELVSRIHRHVHGPSGDSAPVEYGDLSSAPRTFGVLSGVSASANTVAVSGGIEAVVWDGQRYVTVRVTRDVTLAGDATSNASEYLYLSTSGVSKSTTAPVFSGVDGFWISGTDRTLRWIGVMLPRTGSAGAYTYRPISVIGGFLTALTSFCFDINVRSGAMEIGTTYTINLAAYCVADALTHARVEIVEQSEATAYYHSRNISSIPGAKSIGLGYGLTNNVWRATPYDIPMVGATYTSVVGACRLVIAQDFLRQTTHRW